MFRIETETDRVDKRRRELLLQRLRAANTAASPVLRAMRDTAADRESPVGVWAWGEDGGLVAGLDGHVWAGWLHVNLLWVDAGHRGRGLGSRLLAESEELTALRHGCRWSRVSTWDFQAPGFYRGQGYEVVCAIPDYPPGVTEYTLTKRLPAR
ncbi:GNAT family N-acetyltransferase [Streptomyces sp. NPDC050560]|uniref:GNAT family N-acetyltransferase n=1 Tax=Streptomyces sp. NPDC050560 TaxID=3365630 RepID=UPI00378B052E